MNALNTGCGASGRDFSSGWNCVPMKNGCTLRGNSMISISRRSGENPENTKPCFLSVSIYFGFTS